MKRTLAALLIAGFCVLGSGCANCGWVYEPFGPGTLCTGPHCDGCCGSPACGPCAAPACETCAPTCSSCAVPGSAACSCEPACDSCDSCGVECANTCASPCGPLSWLFSMLNTGYCGDGCGEIWWGDFHGAPPTCCEPCDRLGQWKGFPGGPGPMAAGGCSSCGGGSTIDYTFQNQPRVLAEPAANVTPIQGGAKPIESTSR